MLEIRMPRPSTPTETERSAGGVLWREGEGGRVDICLIATKGYSRWQLPKGHLALGESEADAARREVREETGCTGEVEDDLGEIVFWFYVGSGNQRRRIRKSVRFFLLRYTGGVTSDHDTEVDDACWFPSGEARRKLTFDSERDVLHEAVTRVTQALRKQPPAVARTPREGPG